MARWLVVLAPEVVDRGRAVPSSVLVVEASNIAGALIAAARKLAPSHGYRVAGALVADADEAELALSRSHRG